MKQARITAFILIMLAIAVSSCLYADSFRFSLVWNKTIESTATLSVVNLDNDTEVTNHTVALNNVNTTQSVARVRYASNEGGIHVISYRATPLMNNNDPSGYAYNLFFDYTEGNETDSQEIQVGTNKSLTYPNGSVVAATTINMGQGGSLTPRYITIRAQLPDLTINTMHVDTAYASTITIERTSP